MPHAIENYRSDSHSLFVVRSRSGAGGAVESLLLPWLVLRDLTCRNASCLTRLSARLFHLACTPKLPRRTSTTTNAMDNSELERHSYALRQELKSWEKNFSIQHAGRKAGRDDIKADAAICMHATTAFYCTSLANIIQLKNTKSTAKSETSLRAKPHRRRRQNVHRAANPLERQMRHRKSSTRMPKSHR
jgi:hypothetical protein